MASSTIESQLASHRGLLLTTVSVAAMLLASPVAVARPLGSSTPSPSVAAVAAAQSSSQEAARMAREAQNSLKRATQAVQAMQAAQSAARDAASAAQSNVPNGLRPGGLQVAPGAAPGSELWQGAKLPTELTDGSRTKVTVQQTQQKAILNWQTFNVGKETDLHFDQRAGGADAANWIALNRVVDPSAAPSRILGSIKAEGQVYVINRNGIIFGGSAQVNVATLVASSLSLSNEQFLAGINKPLMIADIPNETIAKPTFGYLGQPQPNVYVGLDDPSQVPATEIGAAPGDVRVEAGAKLTTANGGKAMLFAPKVVNNGQISAPDGQVIMAAGEQVYLMAAPITPKKNNVRGFDVAVSAAMRWMFNYDSLYDALIPNTNPNTGEVLPEPYPFPRGLKEVILPEMAARGAAVGYSVVNNGVVSADRGNVTLMGREIVQNGGLHATTALNNREGSIILRAWDQGMYSYSSTLPGSPLQYWSTGRVTLGPGSVTTIIPETNDSEQIEGSSVPTRYQAGRIELRGTLIDIENAASVIVPSGTISIVASKSVLEGEDVVPSENPRDGSRVYLGEDAYLSVAGLQDVLLAMESNVVTGELRINELRDSPLFRDSWLRGKKINVDKRESGIFTDGPMASVSWIEGKPGQWQGTPLADMSAWIGVGKTTLAELSTKGGSILIKSSGSVITRPGSILDVSGGSVRYQDGWIQTTKLLGADGRIYDISEATPERAYIAFAGGFTRHSARWNVTETWMNPLGKSGRRFEKGYTEGHDAGSIQFYAAEAVVLEGGYWGGTIIGERQGGSDELAKTGTLTIGGASDAARSWLPGNVIIADNPMLLPADFIATTPLDSFWYEDRELTDPNRWGAKRTYLDSDVLAESGMGKLAFYIAQGFTLNKGETLELTPGTELSAIVNQGDSASTHMRIEGTIRVPGGSVLLTGNVDEAKFGPGAVIDVSGEWVNGPTSPVQVIRPMIDGGSIQAGGGVVEFAPGVILNVSGGGWFNPNASKNKLQVGDAGSINLALPDLTQVSNLDLRAYAAGSGGALNLTTQSAIQVGGATPTDPAIARIPETLFADRGFRSLTIDTSGTVVVPDGAQITQLPVNVVVSADFASHPSGTPIVDIGQLAMLPLVQRVDLATASLNLSGSEVTIGAGAVIQTDVGGSISLGANVIGGDVIVRGTIEAPAGGIGLSAANGKLVLADGAALLARGIPVIESGSAGLRTGQVLKGGSVGIRGQYVELQSGSLIDVSGASGEIDVPAGNGLQNGSASLRLDSDGGSITISGVGIVESTFVARAGGPKAVGGSISFEIPGGGGGDKSPRAIVQEVLQNWDPDCYGFAVNGVCSPGDWRDAIGFDLGQIFASYGYEVPGPIIITPELLAALPETLAGNIILSKTASVPSGNPLDAAQFGWTPETLAFFFTYFTDSQGQPVDLRVLLDTASQIKPLVVRPNAINAGGFANLSLKTTGAIQLEGVNLAFGRSVSLEGALTNGNGASSTIRAPYISLTGIAAPSGSLAGTLTLSASLIDIMAKADIRGFANSVLEASDIRLSMLESNTALPQLNADGVLTLKTGQVYPASETSATIKATDKIVVQQNGSSALPLSVGGQLTLDAPEIEQGGTLRAPFGTITLKAGKQLTLGEGSTTSVSGDGLTLLYGNLSNDELWTIPNPKGGASIIIAAPPEKRIILDAPTVSMASGSVVDIRGGGDLLAWEHVPGPGGSHDILAQAGMFAIIPSVRSNVVAPTSGIGGGDRIWLAGGGGLAAGWYTLLPARYAMLPGAYAVSLANGSQQARPMSNSVKLTDGSFVMSGFRSNAFGGQDQLSSTWRVMSGETLRQYSEYNEAFANTYFASDAFKLSQYRLTGTEVVTPRLPMDGGSVVFKATQDLVLNGQLRSQAAPGGRGGLADIAATKIAIVGAGQDASALRADGYLVIDSTSLTSFGAGSLLIGGTRSGEARGLKVDVIATDIAIRNDEATALVGPEVILAATAVVDMGAGSVVVAKGEAPVSAGDLVMKPQVAAVYVDPDGQDDGNPADDVLVSPSKDYGALVRVSMGDAVRVIRENVDTTIGGIVRIGENAQLKGGKALLIDATQDTIVGFGAQLSGAALSLSSGRIGFGGGSEGLVLDAASLAQLAQTQHLTLRSYSSIDFHTSVNFGGAGLNAVTLDSAGLLGYGNNEITITGNTIALENTGASFGTIADAGHGQLALIASELVLGPGSKALQGFDRVMLAGTARIVGEGNGTLDAGAAALTLVTPVLTGRGGSSQAITTTGTVAILGGGQDAVADAAQSLGSRIALTGSSISFAGRIMALGGAVDMTATNGSVVLADGSLIDVGGFEKQFFDVAEYAGAGRVALTAIGGDVRMAAGSRLNLAGHANGGSAGTLSLTASGGGTVLLGASIDARARAGETSGSFSLDIAALPDFAALSQMLNTSGFSTSRQFRIRSGDVLIDGTTNVAQFDLVADQGSVTVSGTIDARAPYGGSISISGGKGLTMLPTAALLAGSTTELGSGRVTLEASGGKLDLRGGSIDVAGGEGGRVRFRALQTAGHDGMQVANLNVFIADGARSKVLEGVARYNVADYDGVSVDSVMGDAVAHAESFVVNANVPGAAAAGITVASGIEIYSHGDMILNSDWDLAPLTSREGGLTLRAAGNLVINGNLSDGFSAADRSGQLLDAKSWDIRLVAGADLSSASALALKPLAELPANSGSLIVGSSDAGKLIRTGSGDIDVRVGRDLNLAHHESVIYTAGRKDTAVFDDFVSAPADATYGILGGHLGIAAQGSISAALPANASEVQLYSEWLRRQGTTDLSYNFVELFDWNTGLMRPIEQSSWWVDYSKFQQGIGALGGGNVSVSAGGNVSNLLVALPTNGRLRGGRSSEERRLLELRNGGLMTVNAGGGVLGGYYYMGRGAGTIDAGEFGFGRAVSVGENLISPIAPVLSLGDATLRVRTAGDLYLQALVDPLMVDSATARGGGAFMVGQTQSDAAALSLTSTGGDVVFIGNAQSLSDNLQDYYASVNQIIGLIFPSKTHLTALNGAVMNLNKLYTLPGNYPELRILAEADVVPGTIVMSRATWDMLPSPYKPVGGVADMVRLPRDSGGDSEYSFAKLLRNDIDPNDELWGFGHQKNLTALRNPEHLPNENDYEPSRIYARTGSIINGFNADPEVRKPHSVTTSEQTWFRAGTDIRGINYELRNVRGTDVSLIEAGNDIIAGTFGTDLFGNFHIRAQGPGAVVLAAGRDVYSEEFYIWSLGNRSYSLLDTNRPIEKTEIRGLPTAGAQLSLLAGLNGKQPSYDAFIAAYLDPANVAGMPGYLKTVMPDGTVLPIYLTDLTEPGKDGEKVIRRGLVSFIEDVTGETLSPLGAWGRFQTLPRLTQERFLREVYMHELRDAGRDEKSETVENGLPRNGGYNRGYAAIATLFPGQDWKGDVRTGIALFRTMAGGDIEVMTPGGGLQVAALGAEVPNGAGLVTLGYGNIHIFARNDVTVNRSRINTFAGGDIAIWSTVGDIDAGRGAKTTRVPAEPEILTDADGNTKILEKADISGSGIGTIIGFAGVEPGDVDLITPEGTVNAGDAGIRVSGNFTLAARFVLNADNIQVSGKATGVPKQESAPLIVPVEGDQSKEASKAAEQALRQPEQSQPSIIIVELLGFGGGDADPPADEKDKRGREHSEQRTQNPDSSVQVVGAGELDQSAINQLTPEERKRLIR